MADNTQSEISLKQLATEIADTETYIKNFTETLSEFKKMLQNIVQAGDITLLKDSVSLLITNMDDLTRSIGKTSTAATDGEMALKGLDDAYTETDLAIAKARDQAGAFSDMLKEVQDGLTGVSTSASADIGILDGLAESLKKLNEGGGKKGEEEKSPLDNIESFVKNIKDFSETVKYLHGGSKAKAAGSAIEGETEETGLMADAGAMMDAIPEVAVIAIAAGAAKMIGDAISFHDNYVNAKPQEQLQMDEKRALDTIKELNTYTGQAKNFLLNSVLSDAGGIDLIQGDIAHYGLGDLAEKHPEILKDQEYVKEVRRILDIKGDQNLIQQAIDLGYTLPGDFGIEKATKLIGTPESSSLNIGLLQKYNLMQDEKTTPHKHRTDNHITHTLRQNQNSIIGQPTKVNNIHIDNLIKDFTVNASTLKDSIPDIKRLITSTLTDAVNDSQIIN